MNIKKYAVDCIKAGLMPLPPRMKGDKKKQPTAVNIDGNFEILNKDNYDAHAGFVVSLFVEKKGIGFLVNSKSPDLFLIDVDSSKAPDADEFNLLVKKAIPKELWKRLTIESTPSGGLHLYGRCKQPPTQVGGLAVRKDGEKLIELPWYSISYPTTFAGKQYTRLQGDVLNASWFTEEELYHIIEGCKSLTEVKQSHLKLKPGESYISDSDIEYGLTELMNLFIDNDWTVSDKPNKKGQYTVTRPGTTKSHSGYIYTDNDIYIAYLFSSGGLLPENCSLGYTEIARCFGAKIKDSEDEEFDWEEGEFTDLNMPLVPSLVEIETSTIMRRGAITSVTGKSKSGKTFIMNYLLGALISQNHLSDRGILPIRGFDMTQDEYILYYDLEMEKDLLAKRIRNVKELLGIDNIPSNLKLFSLRDISPTAAKDKIEKTLQQVGHKTKAIFIDTIADLVNSVNDEEESNHLVRKLMEWADNHNISVVVTIHINPGSDTLTRGHLGSQIERKAFHELKMERDSEGNFKLTSKNSRDRPIQPIEMFWDNNLKTISQNPSPDSEITNNLIPLKDLKL